jgi:hypothetical protein
VRRLLLLFLLLNFTVSYSQTKKETGADPWAGTFKLDTAKSKFAMAAPKEETVTVDAATKESVKYSIKGTDAQGKSYTVTFDGKPGTASPQMVDGNNAGEVTYTMLAARSFSSRMKGSDGSSSAGTVTLSKDGKTITVHETTKDAKGASHAQTAVYDRQ